jgi:hypothetical protein
MMRILDNTTQNVRRICGNAAQQAGKAAHAFILDAIQILTHSPQIGRPVKDGKRELVSLIYPPKPPADNPNQAGLF